MKGISCAELLQNIPDEVLERIEESTEVNKQAKKLTGKILFKLLLYSFLNVEKMSLRNMADLYHTEFFQVFAKKDKRGINHSGIGERLANINFEFFREIFEYFVQKFKGIFKLKDMKQKVDITKFDSTMVGLSSKLLKLGMYNGGADKGKVKQLKYTIGLKNSFPCDVELFTKQEEISEEIALKKVILKSQYEKTDVVIFDRGIQRRKTFEEFTEKNIFFVTRLKEKVRYKEIQIHKNIEGKKSKTLKLKNDIIVQLKDETEKFMKQEFRLIIAESLETGEELKFITNIMDLNAREITDIYKKRWGIEMFFRFIKQELSFKHLVSRSENGIKVMLYMTLIVSLLLLIYKTKNKIEGFKRAKLRFALELEMELTKDLIILCNGDISKLSKYRKPVPS